MPAAQKIVDTNLDFFLRELTELSLKYRIGITEPVGLFVMEDQDFDLVYSCDADGRLVF